MKIVVTGGAGFIGSHLVEGFLAEGHDVIAVDNLATGSRENVDPRARFYELDIRYAEFSQLVRLERPDVIDHHAAQTMVRVSSERPQHDADVNVLGMVNLLEGAVAASVRKVIFASSGGTVYGTVDRLPITEGQPFAPESPYGISKAAGELYLRYYAANRGLNYTALRYANVYGPRDTTSSEHVITVFVHQLLRGLPVTVHWDGQQAKDYVHVDDVVRANLLALEAGDNRAYNIGGGEPISVNRILRSLMDITGVEVAVLRGPKRVGDVRCFYFDCTAADSDLGWRPEVAFEAGLPRTVSWYQQRWSGAA